MSADFETIMTEHFINDKENFDKIQEQMAINGEHLSHFSKNIFEMKEMIKEQIRINQEQSVKLDEHIKRVEPMLKSYEADTQFNTALSSRAKKWGGRITFFAAIVAALIYLRHELIKLLQ